MKGHWAKDKVCRAKSQKCWKCGSLGHFSNCCPNQSKSVDAVQILSVSAQDVNAVREVPCPYYTVTINRHPVRMLVDTGSAVSIIPARLYHQNFSSVQLRPAGPLSQWNGSGINVLGKMTVTVRGPDSGEVLADIYVAVGQLPLMGRDLQQQLALTVRHGNVVCQVSSQVLPAIRGYVHKVRLRPDAVPVQLPLRTMPYALRDEVGAHLEDLERQGIIERVDRAASPWLSPIVAIRKRGGKGLRICLDLSEVNRAVISNGHPIPDMQEMLEKLRGAKCMSTLDMKSAYHQLELHESSRDLTAFIHDGQTWRYRRCCFGLKSMPQCFQKLMECVLTGVPGVHVYLDDVIVTGGSRQEHDDHLQQVLRRLEDHNITLNRQKCKIGVTSVDFLGFTVTDGRISVSSERVQGLRSLAVPKSKKELQAVLGSLGFYCKFVPGYSTRVESLRRQLRKDAPEFAWTPEMDAAFNDVRQAILDSDALSMFDPSLPTVVTTDASDVGLGAVLSQVHPEGERVVAFASSTLNAAQRRYSVTEREGLACVWACEKWHKYLWGQEFVLRTDHAALKSLLTVRGVGRAGMRMSRWAVRLMNYSKWPEMAFVREPSSDAVIDFLLTVTSREGWPREVVTDNGTHFTSVKFGQFLKKHGVKHVRVSPYHPAGSGAVERLNRDIKSALQMADQQSVDRRQYLQSYLRTYRATPHGTTGRSPSELLHGRQMRTDLDSAVAPEGGSTGDAALRQRVSRKQRQMKRHFDNRKRVCAPTIQVGDWVRYRVMPRPRKGRPRFSSPCRVTARRGPASYELEGGVRVHAERLSRCSPPDLPRSAPSPGCTGVPEAEVDLPCQPVTDSAASSTVGLRRRAPIAVDAAASAATGDVTSEQSSVAGAAAAPSLPRDAGDGAVHRAGDHQAETGTTTTERAGDESASPSEPASPYRTRSGRVVRAPDRFV
ncbi:uncharacterized protein K02A2.6-like [Amphibalanus amphitrite]|uniref:uncharacterized protein K02A2.6-like n=1 Tax=Amphibalanus amphitrite TaxID=1232801 RepID=UPI001C91B06E|nr:uncharacterized protein K02A2.6-like [Amphibalanus amphitrite]